MSIHVLITGSVQGVGYRQFVKSNARKLGIQGWVRNVSDGSVEAVFHGEDHAVHQLLTLCKKGPFLAVVEDIVVKKEVSPEKFSDFRILDSAYVSVLEKLDKCK